MTSPLGIGALLSGEGRSVLNLARRIQECALHAEIRVVIAHDASLAGVARCREIGLDVRIVSEEDRGACSDTIDVILGDAEVELVCLCGYLRRFRVGDLWRGKVVNIHPSLLPDFGGKGMYGRRVHQAVLDAGRLETGCTVHWVDEDYDRGPIILQKRCKVEENDDSDTLAARVFELECRAYPEALERITSALRKSTSMCES